ncbi:IRK-interacting protein-like [Hordeum vulgare]|nr:IRK-interacting protein-like [Hordeum vulgare]
MAARPRRPRRPPPTRPPRSRPRARNPGGHRQGHRTARAPRRAPAGRRQCRRLRCRWLRRWPQPAVIRVPPAASPAFPRAAAVAEDYPVFTPVSKLLPVSWPKEQQCLPKAAPLVLDLPLSAKLKKKVHTSASGCRGGRLLQDLLIVMWAVLCVGRTRTILKFDFL